MAIYTMDIINEANRFASMDPYARYGRDYTTVEIRTEAEDLKEAEKNLKAMIPEGYTQFGGLTHVWTEEEEAALHAEWEAKCKAREAAHAVRMAKKAEAAGMTVEEYEKQKEIQRKIKRAEKNLAEMEKEMEALRKKMEAERAYIENLRK